MTNRTIDDPIARPGDSTRATTGRRRIRHPIPPPVPGQQPMPGRNTPDPALAATRSQLIMGMQLADPSLAYEPRLTDHLASQLAAMPGLATLANESTTLALTRSTDEHAAFRAVEEMWGESDLLSGIVRAGREEWERRVGHIWRAEQLRTRRDAYRGAYEALAGGIGNPVTNPQPVWNEVAATLGVTLPELRNLGTGVAGKPGEWIWDGDTNLVLAVQNDDGSESLQRVLLKPGTSIGNTVDALAAYYEARRGGSGHVLAEEARIGRGQTGAGMLWQQVGDMRRWADRNAAGKVIAGGLNAARRVLLGAAGDFETPRADPTARELAEPHLADLARIYTPETQLVLAAGELLGHPDLGASDAESVVRALEAQTDPELFGRQISDVHTEREAEVIEYFQEALDERGPISEFIEEKMLEPAVTLAIAWDDATHVLGVHGIDFLQDIVGGSTALVQGEVSEGFRRFSQAVTEGPETGRIAEELGISGTAAQWVDLGGSLLFDPLTWLTPGGRGAMAWMRQALTDPALAARYLRHPKIYSFARDIATKGDVAPVGWFSQGMESRHIRSLIDIADPKVPGGSVAEVFSVLEDAVQSSMWLPQGPGRYTTRQVSLGIGRAFHDYDALPKKAQDWLVNYTAKASRSRAFDLTDTNFLDESFDRIVSLFGGDQELTRTWMRRAASAWDEARGFSNERLGLLAAQVEVEREAADTIAHAFSKATREHADLVAQRQTYDEVIAVSDERGRAVIADSTPAAEGLPPLFHGSLRLPGSSFGEGFGGRGGRNLFGPGIYTTDNPTVARSYAGPRGASPGGTQGVGSVQWTGDAPPVIENLEGPASAALRGAYRQRLAELATEVDVENLLSMLDDPAVTGEALHGAFARAVRDEMEEFAGAVDEQLTFLQEDIADAGIDALQHTGGRRVGGLGEHKVFIWMKPESLSVSRATTDLDFAADLTGARQALQERIDELAPDVAAAQQQIRDRTAHINRLTAERNSLLEAQSTTSLQRFGHELYEEIAQQINRQHPDAIPVMTTATGDTRFIPGFDDIPMRNWEAVTGNPRGNIYAEERLLDYTAFAGDDPELAARLSAVDVFGRRGYMPVPASPSEIAAFRALGPIRYRAQVLPEVLRDGAERALDTFQNLFFFNVLANPITALRVSLDETMRFLINTGQIGRFTRATADTFGADRGLRRFVGMFTDVDEFGTAARMAERGTASPVASRVRPWEMIERGSRGAAHPEAAERWVNGHLLQSDGFRAYARAVQNGDRAVFNRWWDEVGSTSARRQTVEVTENGIRGVREVDADLAWDSIHEGFENWLRGGTSTPSGSVLGRQSIEPGMTVKAADRDNFGRVVSVTGDSARVHFVSPEGAEATVTLSLRQLTPARRTLLPRRDSAAEGFIDKLRTQILDAGANGTAVEGGMGFWRQAPSVPGQVLNPNRGFGGIMNFFFSAPQGRRAAHFTQYYDDFAQDILTTRHANRILDVDTLTAQGWSLADAQEAIALGTRHAGIREMVRNSGYVLQRDIDGAAARWATRSAERMMYQMGALSVMGKRAARLYPFGRAHVDFLDWWMRKLTEPFEVGLARPAAAALNALPGVSNAGRVFTPHVGRFHLPLNLRMLSRWAHMAAATESDPQTSAVGPHSIVSGLTFLPDRYDNTFLQFVVPGLHPIVSWQVGMLDEDHPIRKWLTDLHPALDFIRGRYGPEDFVDTMVPRSGRSVRSNIGALWRWLAPSATVGDANPLIDTLRWVFAVESKPVAYRGMAGDAGGDWLLENWNRHVPDLDPDEQWGQSIGALDAETLEQAARRDGWVGVNRLNPFSDPRFQDFGYIRHYNGVVDNLADLAAEGWVTPSQVDELTDLWEKYRAGTTTIDEEKLIADKAANILWDGIPDETRDWLILRHPNMAINMVSWMECTDNIPDQYASACAGGRFISRDPELRRRAAYEGWLVARPFHEVMADAHQRVLDAARRSSVEAFNGLLGGFRVENDDGELEVREAWEMRRRKAWREAKWTVDPDNFWVGELDQLGIQLPAEAFTTGITGDEWKLLWDDARDNWRPREFRDSASRTRLLTYDDPNAPDLYELGKGTVQLLDNWTKWYSDNEGVESWEDWPEETEFNDDGSIARLGKDTVRNRMRLAAFVLPRFSVDNYEDDYQWAFGPLDRQFELPASVDDLEQTLTGRTDEVFVVDGDTVQIPTADGMTPLRIVGINAPEQGQAGYGDATREMARLLEAGSTVTFGLFHPELHGTTARFFSEGQVRDRANVWMFVDGVLIADPEVFTADNPTGIGVGGEVKDLVAILHGKEAN